MAIKLWNKNLLKKVIPPEEKDGILYYYTNTSIITKMQHHKISKLLNDSTVSKFVTKT